MNPEKAVQPRQGVSELLQTGEPVVFAVDQVPFDVESRGVKNTFCLLVPLMTDGGLELEREQFRNRERVWWMLRPDLDASQIHVGMSWSGPIERSRAYGNTEREKDHYQVRRSEIRPGARHLVEVLSINVAHPDLDELLSPEGLSWPYPPLSRVIVRGGLSVLGPFRARWDSERQRVVLRAESEDTPWVWRMPQHDFETQADIREYSYTANQWDAKAQERDVTVTFIQESDLSLLTDRGEQLDGATDAQIVHWALDFLDFAPDERERFRQVVEHARGADQKREDPQFEERMKRFLKLCENRQRVVELGSEVAATVAKRGTFRELVEKHLEEMTRARVERAVEERREEIQSSTADAERQLGELQARVDGLREEYESQRAAWEEEFQREYGERARQLDEREQTLERQEETIRERLGGLVEAFREKSDRWTEDILAHLPLLQRLGLIGATGGRASLPPATGAPAPAEGQAAASAPVELRLPAFLQEPRPEDGGLDEAAFVDQFRAVVERHGFVFDEEDVANFHVLVKTGLWTVLAGASGLGKSSLPRFYAEALGCGDEYLLVPVRPDWLDDRDVIGAFNALSGRYEPAPSGLVEHLIAAHEDERSGRNGIYIVCMDEMNLARVEHYFAQFLSVLEQPEEERHLDLFARGMARPDDPYAAYRQLRLGKNVRIIGTVNVDETTHFFSPKVIDRVSIAHFERPDLRHGLQDDDIWFQPRPAAPVSLERYLSWARPPVREGEAVDLLLKAEEILRRSRLGLGFRVRDRILRYVSSARELLGEDRAIDFAFVQNVLPALRPIAPRYIELLKDLQGLLPESRFRRSAWLLKALEEDPESDFFQLL